MQIIVGDRQRAMGVGGAMPHFYFHVSNGTGFVRDEEGRELADVGEARGRALHDIRSILSEEIKAGVVDLRGRLDVADGSGNVIVAIPFEEAVELHLEDAVPPTGDDGREGP